MDEEKMDIDLKEMRICQIHGDSFPVECQEEFDGFYRPGLCTASKIQVVATIILRDIERNVG